MDPTSHHILSERTFQSQFNSKPHLTFQLNLFLGTRIGTLLSAEGQAVSKNTHPEMLKGLIYHM